MQKEYVKNPKNKSSTVWNTKKKANASIVKWAFTLTATENA